MKQVVLRIQLPLDDGHLQRACPHCAYLFAVLHAEYESRGLLNLRCPRCRLVFQATVATTARQREYRDSLGRQHLSKMAEEAVDDLTEKIGQMFDRAFRGNPFIQVKSGSHEPTRLPSGPITPPNENVAWLPRSCAACLFSWRASDSEGKSCPICRD